MAGEDSLRRDQDAPWRRPAPRARAFTIALYAWRDPALVFAASILAAAPFVLAALMSPALLSLEPTLAILSPIADARALAGGTSPMASESAPFHLGLLLAADLFFDSPGKIHLAAKALAAILIASSFALVASARFPALQAALMTAALAAFVAAPFSSAAEANLGFFMVLAAMFLSAPADERRRRALIEGVLAGAILFALWISDPLFALLGFLALSACPFLSGRAGLPRYAAALVFAGAFAVIGELAAPGLAISRAVAASGALAGADLMAIATNASGLAGVAASTAVILFAAAVFGGGDHVKAWGAAFVMIALSFIAARIVGAQPAPLFALAAAIAVFSVASPFYDGVFRAHDRASIAVAGSVAALTLFWTASIIVQATGQFSLQFKTAAIASGDTRAEFGLVQPGGPTIARWVEEGRFSTPEARELFALAPIDQSAMLLEAAERVRTLSKEGIDAAILTGADTGCVLVASRKCRADGRAAAERAKVVLVPRLDLDAATTAIKGKSEALLYTEFRMVEQTPLWDIWVRRGVSLPAGA